MSYHKCFYCERKLSEVEDQVEHYKEVAAHPHLAFEWENLFLACAECNKRKRPHKEIPVDTCLNPCDEKLMPNEHLTFEQEIIRAKNHSTKGLHTIQKYCLERDDLNLQRLRRLQGFYQLLEDIRKRQIADGGRVINEQEKELLLSFQQPDQPFSLMFQCYFAKNEF
ncbi:MAG: HNH endonuclease [Caldilineaceae bacterium]